MNDCTLALRAPITGPPHQATVEFTHLSLALALLLGSRDHPRGHNLAIERAVSGLCGSAFSSCREQLY